MKKNFLPMEHLGESQCAKNTQISFTVQAMKIMLRFFSLSVLISVALGVWVRFSLLQDKTSRYNVLSPSENKAPTGIIYCVAES